MARRVSAWIPAYAGTTMLLSVAKLKAHGCSRSFAPTVVSVIFPGQQWTDAESRPMRAWRAASWSGSRLRPLLSEESATPYLVVPREGGGQAFVYLRRLSGWISLTHANARIRQKRNSRRDAETQRSEQKCFSSSLLSPRLRVSARVSLHTA